MADIPSHDPNATVVVNVALFSNALDDELEGVGTSATDMSAVTSRINAIKNRPPEPTLTLSDPIRKPEGNSGATIYEWLLTLNRDGLTDDVNYSYSVVGSGPNPADANDFGGAMPSGGGTFAKGAIQTVIQISVTGDKTIEQDEQYTLVVGSPGIASVSAVGTIANDDSADIVPNFYFSGPASIGEGNPETVVPNFQFTGPATIGEGNPVVLVPNFSFNGPATIVEGDPPQANYSFTGPATITEGN